MPCFRLVKIDSVVFSGRKRARMIESDTIGARKDSAFSPKHHFSPSLAKVCPASAGPTMTATLNWIEFRAMAFGMSSFSTKRGNQRLVGRTAKGLRETGDEREAKDMPDVDQTSRHQNGEQPGAGHLHVLGAEQNLPALHAVGDHAADQGEQKDGKAAEKLIQRQQERRVAQPVDQPALRHDLHPGADAGRAGAKPHQAEIAILKCFKDPADHL